MDTAHLVIFGTVYLAVVLLPGPGVIALVARVIARGTQGAPAYIAGFVAGSLFWFFIAVTGLAAMAAAFGTLFQIVRYAGAIYLLYPACKFWRGTNSSIPATTELPSESRWSLFLTGLALNVGNPKAVVFFLALLPTIVDVETLTLPSVAELATLVALIVSLVFGIYAAAAVRLRRIFSSTRAMRMLTRGSSIVLVGAAAMIARR